MESREQLLLNITQKTVIVLLLLAQLTRLAHVLLLNLFGLSQVAFEPEDPVLNVVDRVHLRIQDDLQAPNVVLDAGADLVSLVHQHHLFLD